MEEQQCLRWGKVCGFVVINHGQLYRAYGCQTDPPPMLQEGGRWKSGQQSSLLGLQPITCAPVEEPRPGAVLLSQSEVQLGAPPQLAFSGRNGVISPCFHCEGCGVSTA